MFPLYAPDQHPPLHPKQATVWWCDGLVCSRKQAKPMLTRQLAFYLQVAVEQVVLDWSTGQAPRLLHPTQECLSLGISYCGAQAVVGVAPANAFGIDLVAIEAVPDWEQVSALYLGPSLTRTLAQLTAPEREQAFASHWALLEAQLKCMGCGLLEWSVGREQMLQQTPLQVKTRVLRCPAQHATHVVAVALNVGAR